MRRHRFIALIAVLAVGLVAAAAPSVLAQSAAERFAQVLESRDRLPVLSGPYEFTLEQTPGVLTVYRAGIDVSDFVAHAVFTNPEADLDLPWDFGFQFRTTGDNEDYRLFAVSTGTWNFSIGTDVPEQTVAAPNLNLEPGESNTLDLIVQGFEATLGINGQFAATILLPELDPSGDVYASTGFFSDLVIAGRTVELSEFTVYGPPGTERVKAGPDAGAIPPPRPISLHQGSCSALGEVAQTLTDATYPQGEVSGQATAVVSETSFTRVPFFLEELLDQPFAINVGASTDEPGLSIVCGDIGGVFDELGAYVIGLQEQNGSGYRGIAYVAPDPQTGRSSISVFLAPPVFFPQEDVPAATDEVLVEEPAAATPVPVITIEDLGDEAPADVQGTPVA